MSTGVTTAAPRAIFSPSSILLVLTNLVPLIGVIWWGWDVFLLLVLYWMETVVIAFWAFVGIMTMPRSPSVVDRYQIGRIASRIGLVFVLGLNAGIFVAAHFFFLWVLLAGDWANEVHDPDEFLRIIVLRTGLWLPLVFMFLMHGFSFGIERWRARPAAKDTPPGTATAMLYIDLTGRNARSNFRDAGSIVGGLYSRIVIMQMTIIFGAWLMLGAGTRSGPLVVLVVLKTIADLGLVTFYGPQTNRAP